MEHKRSDKIGHLLVSMGKYRAGTASPEEVTEVDQWYEAHRDAPSYRQGLSSADESALKDRLYRHITTEIRRQDKSKRRLVRWLPYAAAVLLFAIGVSWFMVRHQNGFLSDSEFVLLSDIVPGTQRATLTLADGRTVVLEENQKGIRMGMDAITYEDGSHLSETTGNQFAPQQLSLTTPRGGTYKVTLPDGSIAWLNAGSTLRYPSHFDRAERLVELDGEGYFSVKHTLDSQPFIVVSKGQLVEVVGTEFNIMAYSDETETKTTLVEGKVRWNLNHHMNYPRLNHNKSIDLIPGEQVILRNGQVEKSEVDVRHFVAWKGGDFYFNEEPLEVIMRQISRWYDVDIVYSTNAPRLERFGGQVSRDKNLNEVLQVLQNTGGVTFRIEDRKIIVNP